MKLIKKSKQNAIIGAFLITILTFGISFACIYGTWVVRCPNGHDDTVTRGTCNHTCEKCGEKAFIDGAGYIVCKGGHANYISTGTSRERAQVLQSYKCKTCGKECRRDI
jgi:hypothetical protein